jgi:hypothetical protein
MNHREAKFEGSIGILKRRHLKAKSIVHIGKESEGLEETEIFGVNKESYLIYLDDKAKAYTDKERQKAIQSMTEKDAQRIGICRRSIYY